MTPDQVDKRISAMTRAFPDSCVEVWEPLVDLFQLPDLADRHVVAAAHVGRADVIVTQNIRDFPSPELAKWDLHTKTLDEFLLDLLDLDPNVTMQSVYRLAIATRKPRLPAKEVLHAVGRCGAPHFAAKAETQLWRGAEHS